MISKITGARVVLSGVEGHSGWPSPNGSTEFILSKVEVLTKTPQLKHFQTRYMKIYLFLLLPALLVACNSCQNQNEDKSETTYELVTDSVKSFQRITMRHWDMKDLGDTTISHSEFLKMLGERPDSIPPVPIIVCDTIPLTDLMGKRVRDTVICSMMMPDK